MASFLLGSSVKAHTISFNELNGAKLCVEPSSIQVNIGKTDQSPDLEQMNLVKEHLQASLPKTLELFKIPFEEKPSCNKTKGFVYVLYYSQWGKDTNNIPYLVYVASVQVGGLPPNINADFELTLPEQKFENYTSALLFEEELPTPLHTTMVLTNDEMIGELASSWWESYEIYAVTRRAQQALWLRWGLAASVLLASLMIAGSLYYSSKKKSVKREA